MGQISGMQMIPTGRLIPYENNSKKHGKTQLEKLADSIRQFGFLSPCIIDKDFNIIAGHGRVMAAKQMGLEEVPCVFVEGLTEEERKAYIIADNRLSDLGQWDHEKVRLELESLEQIGFDVDLTGFDIVDVKELQGIGSYYGDERERTNQAYNLGLAASTEMTGDFWQMPVIPKCSTVPERLIGFNYAKTSKEHECGIHFFIDDYQFERVWNYPERYVDVLSRFRCCLSPDFSLYMDMPMPMKIWNVYRSRQIGAYLARCGLDVIPTLSWAEESTFQFAFNGIERGSVIAVSTVGVMTDENARKIWEAGMREAIGRIQPEMILHYGSVIDGFDYGGIPTRSYANEVTTNWGKR